MDTPVKEVVDNQHEHQVNRSGKRRRLFKKAEADGEKVEDQPSMPTSETRRGLSRTLTRCPTAEISVTTSWRPGLSMFGSRHGGQQPHPPLALPSLSPPRDMVHFDMGAVKVNSRVLQM